MTRVRFLFALAVLLGTSFAARALAPGDGEGDDRPRARAVAAEFDGWTGFDEAVPDRVFYLLETDDVIVRRYRRGREEAVLAVAASRAERKVAHPPEVCLRASGFEVCLRESIDVPGLPDGAIRLLARRGEVTEQVLYWYVVEGRFTPSYVGHQVDALLGRFRGRSGGAALVRISIERDGERALEDLVRFAADAAPEIRRAFEPVQIAGHRSGK